ncbi:MAG: hypothetical protein EVA89_14415, partial [Sandaracinaceae bacterium]
MTRAPTEFRYWDRLDRPAHRWMRRASRALGGFDLAPPDDVVRAFADMYYDADPLAEAFVRDVYLTRGMAAGRAMLEDALANGAGPDAPLTLMGGSVAPGIALRAMGYRPSRADIEATMHFWRYV